MLLDSLNSGSRCFTVQTFSVLEYHEMQVSKECFKVDCEMLLLWDEEAMGLLHMDHTILEIRACDRTKEALAGRERLSDLIRRLRRLHDVGSERIAILDVGWGC